VKPSLVDPHGFFGRFRHIASYAATYGDFYARIVSAVKVGDEYRMLDVKDQAIRNAIQETGNSHDVEAVFRKFGASCG
jgi:Zn-dependent oligopeptidase